MSDIPTLQELWEAAITHNPNDFVTLRAGQLADLVQHATKYSAINAELLEALKAVDEMFSAPGTINQTTVRERVRAAIRKARERELSG